MVLSAPGGDLLDNEVRPVEAILVEEDGTRQFLCKVVLEDGDLDRLAAGVPIWISFSHAMVPWSIYLDPRG